MQALGDAIAQRLHHRQRFIKCHLVISRSGHKRLPAAHTVRQHIAIEAGHHALWDLIQTKEAVADDVLGMRHRRGQQSVDVSREPDVLDTREHGLLNHSVLGCAGLQRQVAASHVLQGSVTTVLVKHLAYHCSVALAGNAEHSQRTGCLCLHALHALLNHSVKGDLLAQLELVHISGRALVHHLEQTGQLVGAGLQHLERLVSLNSVGHHAAIIANQA